MLEENSVILAMKCPEMTQNGHPNCCDVDANVLPQRAHCLAQIRVHWLKDEADVVAVVEVREEPNVVPLPRRIDRKSVV
jgi:hypothetical protein